MNGYQAYASPACRKSGYVSPRRVGSPLRALSPRCSSPRMGRVGSPIPSRVCSPNRSFFVRPNSIIRPLIPANKPAYKRIQSDRSIKLAMLPSFIRIKTSDIHKYTNSMSLSKTRISDSLINESRVLKPSKSNGETFKSKESYYKDLIRTVFDKTLNEDEVLISFGKYSLTRKTLFSLYPEREILDTVIDACLKCLKYKNLRLQKKMRIKSSICCLSTKFCKFLTQKNSQIPVRTKKNMLEYDFVIFPIFVGYWTVLILNIRAKCAKYYDPIGIEKKDDLIFDQLLGLLKREIRYHENKSIENTRWMRLEFERITEYESFFSYDSGAYIIRQVYKVAANKEVKIHPEVLVKYRTSLLLTLFKHGNKITY